MNKKEIDNILDSAKHKRLAKRKEKLEQRRKAGYKLEDLPKGIVPFTNHNKCTRSNELPGEIAKYPNILFQCASKGTMVKETNRLSHKKSNSKKRQRVGKTKEDEDKEEGVELEDLRSENVPPPQFQKVSLTLSL